jgi:hypothetical protein
MIFTPRSPRTQSRLKPIGPDVFLTEDREELLVFLSSKAKTEPAWKFGASQHQSLRVLCDLL